MKDFESTYELFDQYLNGSLNDSAKADFEQRLANETDFKEAFESYQATEQIAIAHSLFEIKAQLQKDIQSGYADRLIKRKKVLRTVMILGGAFLIGVLIYALLPESKTTIDKESVDPESVLTEKQTEPAETNKTVPEIAEERPVLFEEHKKSNEDVARVEITPTEKLTNLPQTETNLDSNEVTASITKNELQETNSDPCADFAMPPFERKIIHSCKGKDNGELLIKSKHANISFSLKTTQNTLLKARKNTFQNLAPSNYWVVASDEKGCTSTSQKPIIIKEEACGVTNTETEEFAFRPEFGEVWEMPVDDFTNATLIIYNQGGTEIYKSEIINGYPNTWDGYNANKGMYLYILQLKDGETKKGYVRIY